MVLPLDVSEYASSLHTRSLPYVNDGPLHVSAQEEVLVTSSAWTLVNNGPRDARRSDSDNSILFPRGLASSERTKRKK